VSIICVFTAVLDVYVTAVICCCYMASCALFLLHTNLSYNLYNQLSVDRFD